MAETIRHRNTEKSLAESVQLEIDCNFPDFSTELLVSNNVTSVIGRKLRIKLLKEIDLDVPKRIEQIQKKHKEWKKQNEY